MKKKILLTVTASLTLGIGLLVSSSSQPVHASTLNENLKSNYQKTTYDSTQEGVQPTYKHKTHVTGYLHHNNNERFCCRL